MAEKPDRRAAKPGAGDTIKITRNAVTPGKPAKLPNDGDAPALTPPTTTVKANKAVVTRKPRKASTKPSAEAPSPAQVAESVGAGTAMGIGPIAAATSPKNSDRRIVKSIHERNALIQLAAFYRAEKRGFTHGQDQADWFAAERDVDGTYRFV